jgi:hypothetical protein
MGIQKNLSKTLIAQEQIRVNPFIIVFSIVAFPCRYKTTIRMILYSGKISLTAIRQCCLMGLLSKAISNSNESIRSLADSQNNLITIKTTNKDIRGLVKLHNYFTCQKAILVILHK